MRCLQALPLAVASLDREAVSSIGAAFDAIDKDHDGRLTQEDFVAPVLVMAHGVNQEDSAKWAGLQAAMDADADGAVSREEFTLAALRPVSCIASSVLKYVSAGMPY